MITSIAFIQQGIPAETPQKVDLNDEEYQRICQMTQQSLSLAQTDYEQSMQVDTEEMNENKNADDDLAEYQLDTYEEETKQDILDILGQQMENELKEVAEEEPEQEENEDEVYLELKKEEEEDLRITQSDHMIVVGKTEEQVSLLEVYVYDPIEDHLYVHHDVMLPSMPLCLEPIHFPFSTENRNFLAVGTFQPEIEIWNLDQVDAVYPHLILGQAVTEKKKKKKNKKQNVTGHSDAVLCLGWHSVAQSVLCSGSADGLVLLWDLVNAKPVQHLEPHSGQKVSALQLHPDQPTVLLTGGYDQHCAVRDFRSPNDVIFTYKSKSDVECLQWDPHHETQFAIGCEDGSVYQFDLRQPQPLFTLKAHDASMTSLQYHPFIPDLLLTAAPSSNDSLKMWDLKPRPEMILSRDTQVGQVYAAVCSPSDPYLMATGGSIGQMSIWNMTESRLFRERFKGREGKRGVVNMQMPHACQGDLMEVGNGEEEVVKMLEEEEEEDWEEIIEELKGRTNQQ